ncbi:sporulation protein YunB [Niallia sp. XMNu-256]|uniref:sporulation protein YunB n=1 Tax=Niallia sp. XMNu-256 TaxID=3082444 RepID=UPI0030D0CC30
MPKLKFRKSMFNKRKIAKKGPLPFRYVLLLTFVFFIFSTAIGFWIVDKELEPVLMAYAKSESVNLATLVINDAVEQQLKEKSDDTLFSSIPNSDEVNNIQLDAEGILRRQTDIERRILENLKKAEEGELSILHSQENMDVGTDGKHGNGIHFNVPLGRVTDNALLANLGPDVPVEFSVIGDVQSDIKTKVVEFGINGGVIEVSMEVEIQVEVIMPFSADSTVVTRNIPIGMGVFRGDVPQFYNGSGKTNPSIQLPKD